MLRGSSLFAGFVVGNFFNQADASTTIGKQSDDKSTVTVHVSSIPGSDVVALTPDFTGSDNITLCDEAIVNRTCQAINANAPEMYTTTQLANSTFVHARDISLMAATNLESVLDLLGDLRMADPNGTGTSAPTVMPFSCQELCERLLVASPPKTLPALSDVGCYGDVDQLCDVDLSPPALATIKFADGGGYAAPVAGDHGDVSVIPTAEPKWTDIKWQKAQTEGDSEEFQFWAHPEVAPYNLHTKLLGFFRIFTSSRARVKVKLEPEKHPSNEARRLAEVMPQTLPRAVMARAFVNQALTNMAKGEVTPIVEQWFGNNKFTPTREAITQILNGIIERLDILDFVYPGSFCSSAPEGTLAYADAHKTSDDRYAIHVCERYFTVSKSEQLKALVHSVAHQETSLLKDVAYGHSSCLALAKACATSANTNSESCIQARTNSYSVIYFVEAAALGYLHPADAPQTMPAVVHHSDPDPRAFLAVGAALGVCLCCAGIAALVMRRKQDWKLFSEDMEDEPDSARELSFRPGDGKIRKKPESLLGFLDVDCVMKEGELKSILKPTAYSCITDESKLNGTMQVPTASFLVPNPEVPTASFLVPNPAVGPTSNYMSVPGVSPPTPPVINPGALQASLGPTSIQDSQGASAAYASSQATPAAYTSSQNLATAYTSSQATPAAYASSQTMPTAYASSQAKPAAYASSQVTSSQATSFSSGLQAPEFGAAFDAGYQFPGLSFTTRGNSEPDQ